MPAGGLLQMVLLDFLGVSDKWRKVLRRAHALFERYRFVVWGPSGNDGQVLWKRCPQDSNFRVGYCCLNADLIANRKFLCQVIVEPAPVSGL
jgi:hypothetical protein